MIKKFPRLSTEDSQAVKIWLDKQKHDFLAEYHKYVACGNISESERAQNYANAMLYVTMMMDYHMLEDK